MIWKTKQDYIKAMKPLTKFFYYTRIIRHIKKLPIKHSGELESDVSDYYQIVQGGTHTAFYKWNWWNPLTWVTNIILLIVLVVAHLFSAIADMLCSFKLFEVKIEDE